MSCKILKLWLIVFMLLGSGCITRTSFRSSHVTNKHLMRERIVPDFFRYTKDNFLFKSSFQITQEERSLFYESFTVFKIHFPKTDKNHTITFHYFKQKNKKKKPLIIVMPITGGSYFFAKYFARYFANAGFHTIWIERSKELIDQKEGSLEDILTPMHHAYHEAVINVMRVIDFAQQQPEIDAKNIGITGTSLGALISATTMGIENRIKAGSFLLGGGDLAYILTHSKEPGIALLRNNLLTRYQWSKKELYLQFKQNIFLLEPLKYAYAIDPRTILQINGSADDVIPKHSSDLLWNALGKPSKIEIMGGHYTSIIYMSPIAKIITKHFKKTLH